MASGGSIAGAHRTANSGTGKAASAPSSAPPTAVKTTAARTTGAKATAARTTGAKTTAAKTTAAKATAAKTTAAKTTAAKTTAAKTTAAKTTAAKATAAKTTAAKATGAKAIGAKTLTTPAADRRTIATLSRHSHSVDRNCRCGRNTWPSGAAHRFVLTLLMVTVGGAIAGGAGGTELARVFLSGLAPDEVLTRFGMTIGAGIGLVWAVIGPGVTALSAALEYPRALELRPRMRSEFWDRNPVPAVALPVGSSIRKRSWSIREWLFGGPLPEGSTPSWIRTVGSDASGLLVVLVARLLLPGAARGDFLDEWLGDSSEIPDQRTHRWYTLGIACVVVPKMALHLRFKSLKKWLGP